MILPVKAEKEKTSTIICFIYGSIYCGKCDKLVIMYDKNYMQYDTVTSRRLINVEIYS